MNAFDHSVTELALGKRLGHQGNRKRRSKDRKKKFGGGAICRNRKNILFLDDDSVFRWERKKFSVGCSVSYRCTKMHFFGVRVGPVTKNFRLHRELSVETKPRIFSGEIFFSDLAWHRAIKIETLLISDTRFKSSWSGGGFPFAEINVVVCQTEGLLKMFRTKRFTCRSTLSPSEVY